MAKPSDELIQLYRAAVEAQTKATAEPYTKEGWAPWREAAATFQQAVTAEAEVTGEGRGKLEQAVKKVVLHPEPAED
ncbi:hypothetical protein OG345_05295 [Streptomyces sp. NBC_01220]|uniref:hypothetical protein n=1 Tax=Streptomyces sp. NBC_01220 TaxID=2903781 RepID=UPI00352E56A6|nr:hypothetical protein OG345_05295 [Streptomyces sp. NBC_01220]